MRMVDEYTDDARLHKQVVTRCGRKAQKGKTNNMELYKNGGPKRDTADRRGSRPRCN